MAVVINDFEVAPAAPQGQAGGARPPEARQPQPESAKKIHKAMQLHHERKRRLAVY